MSETSKSATVRDCARTVIAAIERGGNDAGLLSAGLLEATRPLLARPDLLTIGVKRPANHIDNSKYLYYDGALSMALDQIPNGKFIQPHDHGVWEALILLNGGLHHAVYERTDDGSKDGFAVLETIEDRDLANGEIALVVPPLDIHSFTALEDKTYILTIVGGDYKPKRHYYNVEYQSVVVSTPRALREASGP